jgi:predicted Zn-dependent peptidase
MLYRGSKSFHSAYEQAFAFESLGSTLYAATATDHGLMTLDLPPESLKASLPLLSEVIQYPRFTSIEIERNIVKEEILADLDDDGEPIDVDYWLRSKLFPKHPLGYAITGKLDAVDRFDRGSLRRHLRRHYSGKNATLAIAGQFSVKDVTAWVEDAFGSLPPGQPAHAQSAPPVLEQPSFQYVKNDSSKTEIRMGFRAPGDHHPMEPATEVLLRVIDDGMSTRLYRRLCDSTGLCYDASASYEAFQDDAVFDLGAETRHEHVPQVASEILELCQELTEHGPRQQEVDAVRSRAQWNIQAMLDDSSSLASFYGLSALAGVAVSPAERLEQLCSVTVSDVQKAAELVFQPQRMVTVAVGMLSAHQRKRLERLLPG